MRFVRALLLLPLLALPAAAQNTTIITLSHLIANGVAVPNAEVCASPADGNGITISVASTGWGLVLKDHPFCAQVVNGALPSGLSVPDASHTTSAAAIRYNIKIQVENANGVATGAPILFNAVPNVTGPSFPLDSYTPTVSTSLPPNGLIYATGLPSSCTSPSIVIDQTVPAAYMCSNGSLVPLNVATTATHATTADSATTATTATNANYATTAGSATTATSASTATALANAPTVCSVAGQLPNGVDAHGNALNCAIPANATHASTADSATSATNATTANALATPPSNCGSEAMTGINANGTPVSCVAVGSGSAPVGTQYKLAGFTGPGSGSSKALGQTNASTDATGNPLYVPGAFTAPSIGPYDPTKPLNLSQTFAQTLDYVVPGTSASTYPSQYPFQKTQVIDKRFMGNDSNIAQYINQYDLSGGKNFSAEYSGGASLQWEKPNYQTLNLYTLKQTAGQGGGAFGDTYINLSKGDTMTQVADMVSTGCSDPDDECLKSNRDNYSYDARRFGMTLSSVTADGIGNWILRGTALSGYTEYAAEGLPVLDLTGDLNAASAGNITDMRPYSGDTRFQQLTPDSGINIGTLLGNSTVSFTTSSIAPGTANAGITTAYDGTGGIANATQTVQNASGFTASTTIPVCIGSVADNFEITHIITVNTSTNTLTFDYIRDQHGTNEMVSQGGGCSYAIAMKSDDIAPGSVSGTVRYGGDHGNNLTTLHNAYPILATIGGDFIVYTNSASGAGDIFLHTSAYTNTTPKVAGTLTPTVSGGQLTALAVSSTADYTANAAVNEAGQNVLAYPSISFSGGSCTTQPTAQVMAYAVQNFTQHLPVVSITNAGAGCNNTLTATMQSTGWTNPYHLYPMTMSFKVVDPSAAIDPNTNQHSAAGYFVRTEALNPAKWNVGDNIEISGWWNQNTGGNRTFGQVYGGFSNIFGVRVWDQFTGDSAAYPNTLKGLFNSAPSSKYWSANGPSAGIQYETPPNGYMFAGMMNDVLVFTDPPQDAILTVGCISYSGILDGLSPCHSNVAAKYNIFKGLENGTSSTFDTISYDNGTHTLGFSAPNLMLGGATSTTGLLNAQRGIRIGGLGYYPQGLTFSSDSINDLAGVWLCNIFTSPYPVSVTDVSTCNAGTDAHGTLDSGFVKANYGAELNLPSVGMPMSVITPTVTYTGTAGSESRIYLFVSHSGSTGIDGAYNLILPTGIQYSPFRAVNTAATLNGSNYVTITCPSLQADYAAGDGYTVYTQDLTAGGTPVRNLGICTGASIQDTGGGTSASLPTGVSWNARIGAGEFSINAGGAISAMPSNVNVAPLPAPNAWMTPTGTAGQWKVGKTKGASDGDVEAATWNGKGVCASDGTNCASVAHIPLRWVGTVTLTAAGPDSLTVTGLTASNHCTATYRTTSATAVPLVVAPGSGSVAITHATATAGDTADVFCDIL